MFASLPDRHPVLLRVLPANSILLGLVALHCAASLTLARITGVSINADIETVFLMADPRHQAIASRLVKEIARLDGAIDSFVSPTVAEAVRLKVKG